MLLLVIGLLGCVQVSCRTATPTAGLLVTNPLPTVTVPLDLPMTIALAGRFEPPHLSALDALVAVFEADQPDTWVEIVRLDRQPDRRLDQVSSRLSKRDSSVDLYVLDATWPYRLSADGSLAALNEVLDEQKLQAADWVLPMLQANTVDGRVLALPLSADGGLLFYRSDLLGKHGFDPPKSWADLQAIALEVQNRDQVPTGLVWAGSAAETLTCVTLEFVWSFGGDLLDREGNVVFDSPATRAALEQMMDLVNSGATSSDVARYDDTFAENTFLEQGAVFYRGSFSSWARLNASGSPVAGKVGIAPLPASCLGGQSLALSSYSLQPDKAARFMGFLTTHEAQVQMALAARQPPALESAYQDPRIGEVPVMDDVRAGLAAGRIRPAMPEYPQISEVVFTTIDELLLGTRGVEDAAAQIQSRVEEILDD